MRSYWNHIYWQIPKIRDVMEKPLIELYTIVCRSWIPLSNL
jgi:hypothetical protein